MQKQAAPKSKPLAAALAGLMCTSAMATDQPQDNVDVDQIAPPISTTNTEQIRSKSRDVEEVDIDQLPETLEPGKNDNESQLEKGIAPARTLTSEVLAAWSLIRERGLTPTPDLIAREIGPDKLAEFLASNPAAGNILATGVEPDGNARPDSAQKLPDGVIVVQPGTG